MSGHSKWATIKRAKGANDAKRGAVFTKLANAISIAAKSGGGDVDMNFALRLSVEKAKAANMPHSNIQRAIDRGTGKLGGDAIEEVIYEGYGPGGVGVIVETATDNRNRTLPEVKLAFTKNGGNMAETGAVMFQFSRKGVITAKFKGDEDEAMLAAIEAGAEDAIIEDGQLIVYTEPKQLSSVRDALQSAGLDIMESEMIFKPNANVEITDPEIARKIINLMNTLDDLDDVSNVSSNFNIDGSIEV